MASSSPIPDVRLPSFAPPSPDFSNSGGSPPFDSPICAIPLSEHQWREFSDQIPLLPTPRPRLLTPSGFRHGDDREQRPDLTYQSSSPWFRLPGNLCHDILLLAFGGKKLHMGLGFDVDGVSSEGKLWSWRGCICAREYDKSLGPMTRGGLNPGPWVDHCRSLTCYVPSLKTRKIGIMGWLLSCRQNYAEAINILYAHNTIILSGAATIEHLSSLVIRPRLEAITSLEVKCPLNDGMIRNVLDLVRRNLTSLNRLFISMEYGQTRESFSLDLNETIELFDNFAREMPQLSECAFALPDDLFDKIAGYRIRNERSGKQNSYSQIWRHLGDGGEDNIRDGYPDDAARGKFEAIHLPWVDSYPKSPYHMGQNPGPGYWILEACAMPLDWQDIPSHYTGADEWPF